MKIILSRKGFDSSYGGGASPIMPNGDLLSIPIPANEKEKGFAYSDLHYGENTYQQVMEELGLKIPPSRLAHFDPDLLDNTYPRKKGWKGIFGQHGAALTHLENQGVEVGDLFLFFGSFKRTFRLEEKHLKFERDHPRHIIFGYLRVGEIYRADSGFKHARFAQHPHYQNKELYQKSNAVYVAKSKKDYGNFNYREDLVLTKNGFPKSIWELPLCFHPSKGTTMSRHSLKDFRITGDKVSLQTRGIGQDFVVDGNPEIITWAEKLIKGSEKMISTLV